MMMENVELVKGDGYEISVVLVRQFCDMVDSPYPITQADYDLIVARMVVLGYA